MNKAFFDIVKLFVKRELIDKSKEDVLGVLWILLQPFVFIFMYIVIFSHFFGTKLAGDQYSDKYSYSIHLISGLLLWQLNANIIQNMSTVFVYNANIIKKIPINLLAISLYIPIIELIYFFISMFIFLVFLWFINYFPPLSVLIMLLPVLFFQILFSYSIGLIVAIFTIFIKDTIKILNILLQVVFWSLPIVYPFSILPNYLQNILEKNPFFPFVRIMQEIFLNHGFENLFKNLVLISTLSLLLLFLAILIFNRFKKFIRDIL